jgi:predicted RNase H-like HicB family nuclease
MITFLGAIHKDPGSSYGVSVPDLPGCISASDTFSEALSMAKEAIELYLTSMLDDGLLPPKPTEDVEELRRDPDYADAIWGAVMIDLNWRRSTTAST